MSADLARLEKNFIKDLSNLRALVSWASDVQLRGTFRERRPDIPRRRCPFCHRRAKLHPVTRELMKCCNSAYTKTQRAWNPEKGFHLVECEERVNNNMFPKSFLKRLRHKRHGQNRAFKIRQLARLFQENREMVEFAARRMQVSAPGISNVPAFAEKYWLWLEQRQRKQEEQMQDASRKANQ